MASTTGFSSAFHFPGKIPVSLGRVSARQALEPCPKPLFFFGGTGVCTRDLKLAKAGVLPLEPLFVLVIFDRGSHFLPRLALNCCPYLCLLN
jgi:hypothetical protein